MKQIILCNDGFDDDYIELTDDQFELLEFLERGGYLNNSVSFLDVNKNVFRPIKSKKER